jgi:hypothetical protein
MQEAKYLITKFFKHTTFIKSKRKYKLKGFQFSFTTLRNLNTREY